MLGNIDAIKFVRDRMNIDFAFDIFGKRTVIGQSKRIQFIICGHGCS